MVDPADRIETWVATRLNAECKTAAGRPARDDSYICVVAVGYSGVPLAFSLAAGRGLRNRNSMSSVW
jgi:hypothetical protein